MPSKPDLSFALALLDGTPITTLKRFDQIIDRSRRETLHIRFLNDRRQCPLGHQTRFQKARKIAAFAQLGDAQFDRAGTVCQLRSR